MNKQQALAAVERLSQKIEKGETDLDSWKWARAKAMFDASDAGATQREIGKSAGLNQRNVGRHIAVWRMFEAVPASNRPAYTKAYDEATDFDRDEAQARTDRARAKKVVADEEEREKLVKSLSDKEVKALAKTAKTESKERSKEKVEELRRKVEDSEFDFETLSNLGLWPDIAREAKKLKKGLHEIKVWLELHGHQDVPDPDGGKTEKAAEIILDALGAEKGEIDHAFSEVGVGVSIEAGFERLLSDK
jgi:anti-sigma28 factor (negative regulator of flagellin synthesis)